MAFHRGPKLVTDGLVLYVDAANPKSYISGSTTTTSLVGSVTGSLVGGVGFSTGSNGSWTFDGSNDSIELNSPFGDIDWASTPWSFSSWMLLDTLGNRCLVNLNSANSSHYVVTNVFYGNRQSYWYFIKNSTGTQTNFTTPGVFFTNEIFNFCMTYNGNGLSTANIKFYKNGVQLTTGTGGSAGLANKSGLQLGGNYFLDGNIYTFSLWNYTLSATEVLQNYNATKSRFGL